MGLYSDRPDRQVIPRWRDFRETAKSRELAKPIIKDGSNKREISIQKQLDNWKSNQSFIHAIELINSAVIANQREAAIPAAEYLIGTYRGEDSLLIKAAEFVLSGDETVLKLRNVVLFNALERRIGQRINEIRNTLKNYSGNPVLWVDLARWYTIIGKRDAAGNCILSALGLAPNDIFVLRSAVRFYVYRHNFDRGNEDSLGYALQLIRKNPRTKLDPWLMAVEIGLCSCLKKRSNLIKLGMGMINAKNLSPFALSELTSAIATEELNNGNFRASKKLFTASLIDPNENTVAQGEWAKSRFEDLSVNLSGINSFEASSYNNANIGNWELAFDDGLNWIVDQPFSEDAASHASFLAGAIIDDNDMSIKICNFGLHANPMDFTLLNNKTYSLAVIGDIAGAVKTFDQIHLPSLKDREKVAYLATKGILQYRNGDLKGGNFLYEQAELHSKRLKDEELTFFVKLFHVRSQFICNSSAIEVSQAIETLENEMSKIAEPTVKMKKTMTNLKKRLGYEEKKKIVLFSKF